MFRYALGILRVCMRKPVAQKNGQGSATSPIFNHGIFSWKPWVGKPLEYQPLDMSSME